MFPFPRIPHHLCLWQGVSKTPLHRYMGTEELQVRISLPFWLFFLTFGCFCHSSQLAPALELDAAISALHQHRADCSLPIMGRFWMDRRGKQRKRTALKDPKVL